MDIIDQLKQEQAERERAANEGPPHEEEASEALERAMESLYVRLEKLASALRELNPDARASYEVPLVGTLNDLRQQDYAVETLDPVAPRFAFTFVCVGDKPLTKAASTIEEKNLIREQIERLNLSLHIDDMSTWRYVISVKPIVPVSLVFEPSPDGDEIRMTAHNLEQLGPRLYSLHPEVVRDDLCNEIGKLVLRRENRFSEYSGNHVPEDVRRHLQDKIKARQQSREQVARAVESEATPKGGRLKKLLRMGAAEQSAAPKRPLVKAPDLDGPAGQHDGFIDWNDQAPADADPRREPRAPAALPELSTPARPVEEERPTYAWMITEDIDNEDSSASVGRHGPPGGRRVFSTSQMLKQGERFRLVDRDGAVRFHGMIVGDYEGIEPLVDFGLSRGCVIIQYHRDGEWVRVRAAG